MERVVYENELVKVIETGRNYDYIAVVENKHDNEIQVIFNDETFEPETLTIAGDNWCGILADNNGCFLLEELKNGRFLAEVTQ